MKTEEIEKMKLVEELLETARYRQLRGKVRGYKAPIDPDDLEGELNAGICEAAKEVKFDVGNPKEFLLSRGFHYVQNKLQKVLNDEVIEECLTCGKVRPWRKNACYTCGERNFMLHYRTKHIQEPEIWEELSEGGNPRTKSRVAASQVFDEANLDQEDE